jgi:hypothetical protein
MQIQITDVELNTLFGHSGGWAEGMIARHLHSANSENPTEDGRPKAIDSDKEKKHIQFCLVLQSEKNPVTVQDFIDFMHDPGCKSTGSAFGDSSNTTARH